MFVSALPDPTCNSEKSANGGNKQILLLLLLLLLLLWGEFKRINTSVPELNKNFQEIIFLFIVLF